ncbi:hypothetical protein M1L60_04195 [Actinoplanes sp. TRM 88003]|uniref:Uncharacterized protein n=1 Tax=Paractinoplanes aksuensis TaxID=2939490 RepID=A0ABT1DG37_9ACTN|nr:hypothetical protein [Actinoplanes aksuensis]MCO8269792.1 hypothetical protein [Actinoplanes aksuensis]
MNALLRLATVGAALALVAGVSAPAAAAVTYDPKTMKGYVARADLQKAFGWTDTTLSAKASTLVFNHDFWTNDTYTVACGKKPFPVTHYREFGRYELRNAAVLDKGRGTVKGYSGKLVGFWITGASFGISGTSVPPTAGQPCPDATKGKTITASRRASSVSGWALSVSSGEENRRLVTKETPAQG